MLTSKQKELLMFIHERLKETGVPPSFDEMKEALDLKSKSGIHRLITALEERGFVRRLPHRARAMEIVRLPDSMPQPLAQRSRGFSPSVIEGSLGRVPQLAEGESFPGPRRRVLQEARRGRFRRCRRSDPWGDASHPRPLEERQRCVPQGNLVLAHRWVHPCGRRVPADGDGAVGEGGGGDRRGDGVREQMQRPPTT